MIRFQGVWKSKAMSFGLSDVHLLEEVPQEQRKATTHAEIAIDDPSKTSKSFATVGQMLPTLKSVVLKVYADLLLGGRRPYLSFRACLGELLSQPKNNLEEFHAIGIDWSDKEEADMSCVKNQLMGTENLRKLCLTSCSCRGSLITLLLDAFLGNKSICDVSFTTMWNGELALGLQRSMRNKNSAVTLNFEYVNLERDMVGPLLQKVFRPSSGIREVRLVWYQALMSIDVILQGLGQNNRNLTELHVAAGLDEWANDDCPVFNDAIRLLETCGDHSSLEILKLDVINIEVSDTQIVQMGKAIKNLRKVKTLHLAFSPNPNLESFCWGGTPIMLLDEIAENNSLHHVSLIGRFYELRGAKTQSELFSEISKLDGIDQSMASSWIGKIQNFEHSLEEKNTNLKQVALLNGQSIRDTHINDDHNQVPFLGEKGNLWLKLNAAGRKNLLMAPENTRLWTDTLIEHKEDTSIAFHLLSTNTSVFCPEDWISEDACRSAHPSKKRRKVSQ